MILGVVDDPGGRGFVLDPSEASSPDLVQGSSRWNSGQRGEHPQADSLFWFEPGSCVNNRTTSFNGFLVQIGLHGCFFFTALWDVTEPRLNVQGRLNIPDQLIQDKSDAHNPTPLITHLSHTCLTPVLPVSHPWSRCHTCDPCLTPPVPVSHPWSRCHTCDPGLTPPVPVSHLWSRCHTCDPGLTPPVPVSHPWSRCHTCDPGLTPPVLVSHL
ncbi:hypothetical protein D4764_02G0005990 [Takifugu flavidus]|uniref:Uncharacterized protein n=1 Tax=Takifugu flavidus TaxID=433684 RepID=A0A5C6NLK2_9TELE|nr:hypothetical protein D4764_02G0005990 [Takifugu flavidus]